MHMNWDDDDFDFNEELSDEEREELDREMREEKEYVKNHPLNKQAREVYEVVNAIVGSMSDEGRDRVGDLMMDSAMMIRAKLAGALGSKSWLICMQNGAIIRFHAEHLRLSNHSMREFTDTGKDYAQLLRREMETFRELFREWVIEFQAYEDDFEDDWGLFTRK